MSPSELYRQVAQATGETISEIRSRGFGLPISLDVMDDVPVQRPRRRRRRRRSSAKNGNPR